MNVSPATAKSNRYRGLLQIIRFNWPKYATAVLLVVLAAVLLLFVSLPAFVQGAIALGIGLLLFWTLASLAASHWVYDLSPLTEWHWLPDVLPDGGAHVRRWVNIHAGFDDTTHRLRVVFPEATGVVVDLYDPSRMTERSIRRARKARQWTVEDLPGKPEALPLPDHSADLVLLLLAAHEVRSLERQRSLFREIRRILRPHGYLVLAEHLRDKWNFLAFGPGFRHFFSRGRWLRVADAAGLQVMSEGQMTPLVHYLVLRS